MGPGVAACSARGTARAVNQDHVAVHALDDWALLAVIADGLGGYAYSEVASTLAASLVRAEFEQSIQHGDPALASLKRAVQAANLALWETAIEREHPLRTTLSALVCTPREALIAHVGDCRVYVLRAGQAHLLTRDHSRAHEARMWRWLVPSALTARLATGRQDRHALTRVLGSQPIVQVDTVRLPAQPGDRFVLCSDGIWSSVPEAYIEELAAAKEDNASLAHTLACEAQAAGGTDDASAIVVSSGAMAAAHVSARPPAPAFQAPAAPYVLETVVPICRHG